MGLPGLKLRWQQAAFLLEAGGWGMWNQVLAFVGLRRQLQFLAPEPAPLRYWEHLSSSKESYDSAGPGHLNSSHYSPHHKVHALSPLQSPLCYVPVAGAIVTGAGDRGMDIFGAVILVTILRNLLGFMLYIRKCCSV